MAHATLSDSELLDMAREVLNVCNKPLKDVLADLEITGSSEQTINRILDGEVSLDAKEFLINFGFSIASSQGVDFFNARERPILPPSPDPPPMHPSSPPAPRPRSSPPATPTMKSSASSDRKDIIVLLSSSEDESDKDNVLKGQRVQDSKNDNRGTTSQSRSRPSETLNGALTSDITSTVLNRGYGTLEIERGSTSVGTSRGVPKPSTTHTENQRRRLPSHSPPPEFSPALERSKRMENPGPSDTAIIDPHMPALRRRVLPSDQPFVCGNLQDEDAFPEWEYTLIRSPVRGRKEVLFSSSVVPPPPPPFEKQESTTWRTSISDTEMSIESIIPTKEDKSIHSRQGPPSANDLLPRSTIQSAKHSTQPQSRRKSFDPLLAEVLSDDDYNYNYRNESTAKYESRDIDITSVWHSDGGGSLSPPPVFKEDSEDSEKERLMDDVFSSHKKGKGKKNERSESKTNSGTASKVASRGKKRKENPPIGLDLDLNMWDDGGYDSLVNDEIKSLSVEDQVLKRAAQRRKRSTSQKFMSERSINKDIDIEMNMETNLILDSDSEDGAQKKQGRSMDVDMESDNDEGEGLSKSELQKLERKRKAEEKEAIRKKKIEEREAASKRKAEEREAESKRKAQEREEKKEQKKKEQEIRQRLREEETRANVKLRIANRLTTKSDSVKELVVCIEHSLYKSKLGMLLQDYWDALECQAIAIRALETDVAIPPSELGSIKGLSKETCPLRNMILWRRFTLRRYSDEHDTFVPVNDQQVELEPFVLIYLTAKEFALHIELGRLRPNLETVKKDMAARRNKDRIRLGQPLESTRPEEKRKQRVVYLINGMEMFLRALKRKLTRQLQQDCLAQIAPEHAAATAAAASKKKRAEDDMDEPVVDKARIEEELLWLQMEQDCLIIHSFDDEDTVQILVSLTEQIGLAPYSYQGPKNTHLNVCTEGIRAGRDAADTWIRSLEQIHMVTTVAARSISDVYPSMRSLYEGYRQCDNLHDARYMLEDIELPLSPYGGRFGVSEQPMSTKSLASSASTSKRSPFSKAKSKVNDWTDEKKNLEKRKELLQDFQSGYFAEFSEINKMGSKLWRATTAMVNADKALYMPNIIGTSLKTSEPIELVDVLRGKISLLAISGTRFGEEHVETYMNPFLSKWPASTSNSKVQLVELNIQENPLKAGLVRMMVPFVKKSIPEERHANYILHYKSIKHLRDPLSMQNSYLGYVFLIDSNCKIRWGAHGPASETEIKTLLDSVQRLTERGGR
ncbi:Mitochondrial ATPase complex subunit atp10 [Podila epigama]|nr:Mitochondrial ATPase complex subunit atp10 [Podila epigama]